LASKTKPKVIYTPHAFGFMMQSSAWKRALFSELETHLSLVADAIICGSDYEQRAAIEAGIPPDRLHRIYNGIAIPDMSATAQIVRETGPLRLLFVGRFDRQKGLDVLLNAMSQLPPDMFWLVVVGAPVQDGAVDQPRLPNVKYLGWLPHDELSRFYVEADVLVMPSRWESFGLVAVEAHSHGVPVVAARCCSLPEIVEHKTSGLLFDVDDSAGLANLLLSTPRAHWREMGRAGRQNVEKSFVDVKMLHETDELYRNVLSGRSARTFAARIASGRRRQRSAPDERHRARLRGL
jgi:glycosyltransferase involved in cell wall biosynthesis